MAVRTAEVQRSFIRFMEQLAEEQSHEPAPNAAAQASLAQPLTSGQVGYLQGVRIHYGNVKQAHVGVGPSQSAAELIEIGKTVAASLDRIEKALYEVRNGKEAVKPEGVAEAIDQLTALRLGLVLMGVNTDTSLLGSPRVRSLMIQVLERESARQQRELELQEKIRQAGQLIGDEYGVDYAKLMQAPDPLPSTHGPERSPNARRRW